MDTSNVTTMRYIKNCDRDYPQILNRYEGMPEGLYIIGNFPDPDRRSVAIVGARSCSEYGRRTAREFGRVLAAAGVQVISGMALGIDSSAHEGALEAGGKTFAVLGCGADVCYPASKLTIYRKIIRTGGVISEFEPGTPAIDWHFPIRNRIISALADAVIVVEARKKSGSLITANYALEQNKTVYAVPGRICESTAMGTNDLLGQGAVPAVSPEQILKDLGIRSGGKGSKSDIPDLSKAERKIYRCISSDPKTIQELSEEGKVPFKETASAVAALLVTGLVSECMPGRYIKSGVLSCTKK